MKVSAMWDGLWEGLEVRDYTLCTKKGSSSVGLEPGIKVWDMRW